MRPTPAGRRSREDPRAGSRKPLRPDDRHPRRARGRRPVPARLRGLAPGRPARRPAARPARPAGERLARGPGPPRTLLGRAGRGGGRGARSDLPGRDRSGPRVRGRGCRARLGSPHPPGAHAPMGRRRARPGRPRSRQPVRRRRPLGGVHAGRPHRASRWLLRRWRDLPDPDARRGRGRLGRHHRFHGSVARRADGTGHGRGTRGRHPRAGARGRLPLPLRGRDPLPPLGDDVLRVDAPGRGLAGGDAEDPGRVTVHQDAHGPAAQVLPVQHERARPVAVRAHRRRVRRHAVRPGLLGSAGVEDRAARRAGDRGGPDPVPPLRPLGPRRHGTGERRPPGALRGASAGRVREHLVVAGQRVRPDGGQDPRRLGCASAG